MPTQPTGTVTLLFSDVEGSTRLLERLGTDRYAAVLQLHRRLLREAFERHDGYEFGTEGDALFVAFASAPDAVAAAGEGQQALAAAEWPEDVALSVRMGLHTGNPLTSGSNYIGMDLHRVARITSAGHGNQVLVSETTAALVDGIALRDLGRHRLKDLLEPIQLHQLAIEGLGGEFPPLRSLHRTNLPTAAWPLLGRERELARIRDLIADGARLVTLTGPGGSGKTRLALQAAAELSEEFGDGVFFVPLVPLRESEAVRGAVAEAVGLKPDDDPGVWLSSKRVLLVLDNLEHLAGVDAATRDLLVGETVVVATSRTPLRLAGERELPVEPLPDDAAIELFVSRAAAAGRQIEADETVAAVCRRLDKLPLALELAAARAKLLSPTGLLQRLDAALPLLTGGASDRPERQRTLRATIEWSYDLLDPEAQATFRRLSVFRGSFTLDAAEAVTGADLDQVASLLDQSLLKPLGDDRFFLLETLREYARERLDEAGDTDDFTFRHARYYLSRLEENEPGVRSPRYEQLSWFVDEEDNLRAMFDRLLAAESVEAGRAAHLLWTYWFGRGAYLEARHRLSDVLERGGLGHEVRAMLLEHLAGAEEMLENLEAAEDAARRAVAAAEAAARPDLLAAALRESAWIVARRGQTDESLRLARRAAELGATLDDDTRWKTMHDLGSLLGEAQRGEEAREVFEETMVLSHSLGGEFRVITVLIQVGFIDLHEHHFEEARIGFASALDQNRRIGHYGADWLGRWGLGYALLGLGQRDKAQTTFAEALEFVLSRPQVIPSHLAIIASGVAHTTAPENVRAAARLRGAITALRARRTWHDDPRNLDIELYFDRALIAALDEKTCTREQAAGAALSFEETIALARSLAVPPSGDPERESETLDAATT